MTRQLTALVSLVVAVAGTACSGENPEISHDTTSATPPPSGTPVDTPLEPSGPPPTGQISDPNIEVPGGGGVGNGGGEAGAPNVYIPACGNSRIDAQIGEKCDDGNQDGGDGCTAACDNIEANYRCPTPGATCVYLVHCGDGKIAGPETCDDGVDPTTQAPVSGDGCSDTCELEEGYECPVLNAACRPVCGDALIRGKEQCDDGVDAESGRPVSGDGCSETCRLEEGFVCPEGEPCRETTCGDGEEEGSEQCDDGNLEPFDGCSPSCKREPQCGSEESASGACRTDCGDGILLAGAGEECDDGNTEDGDGCSSTCTFEDGYVCTNQGDDPPEVLQLPIIIRDFQGWDADEETGHPDFQTPDRLMTPTPNNTYVIQGIVDELLGVDRKPVYAGTAEEPIAHTTGPDEFAQWYHDVEDVNIRFDRFLELVWDEDTQAYSMNSDTDEPWASLDGFFPIDDEGWGNVDATTGAVSGGEHNFYFTSELRYWFEYRGGEQLRFSGDDDVWVFINGRLGLDLGGVHVRREGTILLDPESGEGMNCVVEEDVRDGTHCTPDSDPIDFGLELGNVYEVVVFQAERRVVFSNYWLTLSNFSAESSVCEPDCGDAVQTPNEACDLGDELNTGEYGGCNPNCTLAPYCGDGEVDTDAGEQCDDGLNISTYGGCAPGCVEGPSCGDGEVQAPYEDCDNGEDNRGQYGGCTESCHYAPRCGDGVLDEGHEECDDGRDNGATNCQVNCKTRGIY